MILVCDSIDISRLSNILQMGDCVGKRLELKLKCPVSAAKYFFVMSLQKNGSLGELELQGILALSVLDQACYIFVTVREDAFGENYVLKFCGRTYSEVWQGKPRVTWHQIKPIYIWYLKLVVKHLHCINCLNSWPTNWITFWNQKLCSGTVFPNKNDETKNFPGL